MSSDNARRIVAVGVTFELLINMMTRGYTVGGTQSVTCTDGLPLDAKYLWSFTDEAAGSAYLVFEHDSFDLIHPHAPIPRRYITHTYYTARDSV